jgi:hypothetical protein
MGKGFAELDQLVQEALALLSIELQRIRRGHASARQCLQAKPQAWVISQ